MNEVPVAKHDQPLRTETPSRFREMRVSVQRGKLRDAANGFYPNVQQRTEDESGCVWIHFQSLDRVTQ